MLLAPQGYFTLYPSSASDYIFCILDYKSRDFSQNIPLYFWNYFLNQSSLKGLKAWLSVGSNTKTLNVYQCLSCYFVALQFLFRKWVCWIFATSIHSFLNFILHSLIILMYMSVICYIFYQIIWRDISLFLLVCKLIITNIAYC